MSVKVDCRAVKARKKVNRVVVAQLDVGSEAFLNNNTGVGDALTRCARNDCVAHLIGGTRDGGVRSVTIEATTVNELRATRVIAKERDEAWLA